jgi:hypothetical protein
MRPKLGLTSSLYPSGEAVAEHPGRRGLVPDHDIVAQGTVIGRAGRLHIGP